MTVRADVPEDETPDPEIATLLAAPLPDDPLEASRLLLAQGLASVEDEPMTGQALILSAIATAAIGTLAELRVLAEQTTLRRTDAVPTPPPETPVRTRHVRLSMPSRLSADADVVEVLRSMLRDAHVDPADPRLAGAVVTVDCAMVVTVAVNVAAGIHRLLVSAGVAGVLTLNAGDFLQAALMTGVAL